MTSHFLEPPEVLSPRLLYYDKRHSHKPLELAWDAVGFSKIGKVENWPRKVLVFTHGFVDSITRHDSTEWMDPAREKLVKRGNAVILLDWSSGADAVYNYAQGEMSRECLDTRSAELLRFYIDRIRIIKVLVSTAEKNQVLFLFIRFY